MKRHILTTGDVARALSVAPRTAAKLMDTGHLASWRAPGGKDRRTSLAILAEFAAANGIPLEEIATNRMDMVDGLGLPKPRGLRSSRWATMAKVHLANFSSCAACGCKTTKLLVPHHKKPFHLYPELELDLGNLITLCESPSHNCHLMFGHLLNWRSWNIDVERVAAEYLKLVAKRPMPGGPPPGNPPPETTAKSLAGDGPSSVSFLPTAAHAALDDDETRRAA